MTSARAAGGLSALALLLAAGAAARDVPRPPPSALAAEEGRLIAVVELDSAFPSDLQKRLSNGLTNIIAIHVALVPELGGPPAALYGREIDVLYDVWEERYGVTVKDPASPAGRSQNFSTFEALRAFLARASGVELGPLDQLGTGRWVTQTRLELNPVSRELLERTREFIANPGAGGRGGSPSRSVLGAFASYLLRSADAGADVHQLRSPPFTAREVAHR